MANKQGVYKQKLHKIRVCICTLVEWEQVKVDCCVHYSWVLESETLNVGDAWNSCIVISADRASEVVIEALLTAVKPRNEENGAVVL